MKNSINNLYFTPTGIDNTQVLSLSEFILEEKISIHLCDVFFNGNLENLINKRYGFYPCKIESDDGRYFSYFALDKKSPGLVCLYRQGYDPYYADLTAIADLRSISLWQLFSGLTTYNNLKSISYRLNEEPYGYSSYKLSSYWFSQEKFPTSEEKNIGYSEINEIFETRFPNTMSLQGIMLNIPENLIINSQEMSFAFRNQIGEITMKIVKSYRIDNHHLVKCYIPLTYWHCRALHCSFAVKIGLPEKQILFNLDLIRDCDTVIVCSSLEIASANQKRNNLKEIVFTAFVCDRMHFDQVDFIPLKGKNIKLLIANHSGITLAESYQETQKLYEYLRDEIRIENIDFIQMEIQYPSMDNIFDFNDLSKQNPKITEDSIREMTQAEFSEMLLLAAKEIERKAIQSQDMPFWKNPEALASTPVHVQQGERITDKMILRPIVVAGQVTVIESEPGMGKSCFTTALCAQIAGSSNSFLSERCLTRCTPIDNPKRGYKIVYLTFDADGSAISEHRKDFAGDMGDNDKNFIQKDLACDENDYSKEENFDKFTTLLKQIADTEGVPGQAIDVLVIDTLLEFTRGTPGKVHLALRRLGHEFPNMAIILIHHLNKKGESYGGTKETMLPRIIMSLFRTKDQIATLNGKKATLENPFSIQLTKFNTNKIHEDGEPFSVKLDEKNQFVLSEENHITVTEMRKTLIEQYEKKYHLTQSEIGRLFGVTDKTIRNWKQSE